MLKMLLWERIFVHRHMVSSIDIRRLFHLGCRLVFHGLHLCMGRRKVRHDALEDFFNLFIAHALTEFFDQLGQGKTYRMELNYAHWSVVDELQALGLRQTRHALQNLGI